MAGAQGSAQKVYVVNTDEIGGGGGGGGGLTQAQTQAAVTAAINGSADVDTLIERLEEIRDQNITGVPILFDSAALTLTGEAGIIDYSTGTRRVLRLSNGNAVGDAVITSFAGAAGLTQAETQTAFEDALDGRVVTGIPVLFNSAALTLTGEEGIVDYSTGTRRVLRLSNGAVVADAVITSFAGVAGLTQVETQTAFEDAIEDRVVTGIPVLFDSVALTLTGEEGIVDYSTGTRRVLRLSNGAVVADAVITSFAGVAGLTQVETQTAFEDAIEDRVVTGIPVLFDSVALTLTGEEGIVDYSTGTRRVLRLSNGNVVADAAITGFSGLTPAQAQIAFENAIEDRVVSAIAIKYDSVLQTATDEEGILDFSTGTARVLRLSDSAEATDADNIRFWGDAVSPLNVELVEYALNSAPTVFIEGFVTRTIAGEVSLYSDYLLTTLVSQGTAPAEAIESSIRPRVVENDAPLVTILNSTKIIEVPEPGDSAVAGSATIPFRPAPGAFALSATPTDLNGIPVAATAVNLTIWPDEGTRDGLANKDQAYLAAISLMYTLDGSNPSWGTLTLAPNGAPLKYGDTLILSRADALNLKVLANSDTNETVPVSPGRPQITFYGLSGGTPKLPVYTPYDWALLGIDGGTATSGLTQAQTQAAFEDAIDGRVVTGVPILFDSAALTLTGASGIIDYSTGIRRVLRLSNGVAVPDAVITGFAAGGGGGGLTQAETQTAFEDALDGRVVTGTPVSFDSAALTLTGAEGILDYSTGTRRVLRVSNGNVVADAVVTGLWGANNGEPITGQTLEAGGVSVLGWLSSIRNAFTTRIPTLGAKANAGSISVTPATDSLFKVRGDGAVLRASVTRPATTTAYVANSVWGGVFTVTTPYPAGTVIVPTDFEIIITGSDLTAKSLHILSADLVTPIPDSGVWSPPLAEIAAKSFSFRPITFTAALTVPGNTYTSAAIIDTRQSIVVGAGGNIFCYVLNNAAVTAPTASAVMTLKIGVVS